MLQRATIIEALARDLPAHDCFRAATLGGSDATGRADDRSDVDVFLLVEPGTIEEAVAAFDRVVERLSPIRLRLRLPMPTWHGFHQAFYQLENAPEHLMIDWVMVERGQPHPWFEVERHGLHRVLFDKDDLARPGHVDRGAIDSAVRRRVEELRIRFPMFRHLAPKLAGRDLPADAAYFYQSLVLRPLVDLLRCVHCPERHDFGFRYLRDDLPGPEYRAICRLAYPTGARTIKAFAEEAAGLFERALAQWDSRAGAPGAPA